jgi:DNA repair protein RecO (recombination protein O)
MALLITEALVLRGYKLGETSKVVVLLTRERGKVRAVARGARGGRPRYQSALEPLSAPPPSVRGLASGTL